MWAAKRFAGKLRAKRLARRELFDALVAELDPEPLLDLADLAAVVIFEE
ncbi:hypothetical protein phi16_gp032 [Corynebacterium phage phi16]|nr:hypothetical protein phi16_gp032 [Corynebacterium phage phi16]